MFKSKLPFLLLAFTITVGCSSKLLEEGQKVEAESNEKKANEEVEEMEQKEREKLYKEMEKPMKDIFSENDFEEVNELVVKKGLELKESYKDGNEFALFAGNMLFNFQARDISPSAFYDFLKQYGSKSIQEGLQQNREDAITSYKNVQAIYKESEQQPKSYQLSEVQQSDDLREAFFYRKIVTTQGDEEYYLTTIRKEDNHWTFQDDSPSPPYEAIETIKEEKEGDKNGKNN